MKHIKTSILLASIFCLVSFNLRVVQLESNILLVGDTITFSNQNTSDQLVSTHYKRSTKDGSSFELKSDTKQAIVLAKLAKSNGPKQDEILIFGCSGQLTRSKENIQFQLNKTKKKYFLISMENQQVIAEFDTIKSIIIQSTTNNGESGEFYCDSKTNKISNANKMKSKGQNAALENISNQSSIHLIAVPKDIKKKELYLSNHSDKSLAYFSQIEFNVENNHVLHFPRGSYILCEGNSFQMQ